jgi:hypothetical protein
MKKDINKITMILTFFCILVIFITCFDYSDNVENHPYTQISKEFWGEWFNLDKYSFGSSTGKEYYITNNEITEMYSSSAGQVFTGTDIDMFVLRKVSPNIMEMTKKLTHWSGYDYEEKYTLIASRVVDGSINGRVVRNNEARSLNRGRAVTGIGGIDVVVSNLNNSANNQKTKTDENGNFEVDDIIIGDEYEVKILDNVDSTIPNFNGEDVGNFSATGTAISRARLVAEVTFFQNRGLLYLVYNRESSLLFEFTTRNPYVGKIISYEITLPDGMTSDSELTGGMQYVRNPISTSNPFLNMVTTKRIICDPISSEYEIKKIGVKITDEYGECEDTVSVRIFRDKITLYLFAEYPEEGFVSQIMIRNNDIENTNIYFNDADADNVKEHGWENFENSDIIWDNVNNCCYGALDLPKYKGAEYLFVIRTTNNINFAINNNFTPDLKTNMESGSVYNDEYSAKIIDIGEIIRLNTNGEFTFFKLRF